MPRQTDGRSLGQEDEDKFPNPVTKTAVLTMTENEWHQMTVKEPWTVPAKWRDEIDSYGKTVGDAEYEVRPDPAGTTI